LDKDQPAFYYLLLKRLLVKYCFILKVKIFFLPQFWLSFVKSVLILVLYSNRSQFSSILFNWVLFC